MRHSILALGVLLLGLSALLEVSRKAGAPKIRQAIHEGIIRSVVLRKNSPPDVYERYLGGDDQPTIYARFYLWNITNVNDVRRGAKPIMAEAGPYVFTRHRRKLDASFSFNAATVSFNEYYYFQPCPELTNGSLSEDQITTLNLPLVGAIESIMQKSPRGFSRWLQLLARLVEGWGDHRVHGIFTTRTPEELLFGYTDPLLSRAAKIIPGIHVNPRFALVNNMTSPEESTAPEDRDIVSTGATNLTDIWQYRSWHGVTEINAWKPPHVEKVRGTDGSQFRPGLKKGDAVEVWIGEAYRAGKLLSNVIIPGYNENEQENGVYVGSVPVLRFRADPSQRVPDPRYYQELAGVMNVTAAMFKGSAGPQLFLTLPGYCEADEEVVNSVDGVQCDWQRHDVFVDVEPTTGITLRAQKSLMLSSWFGKKYSAVDKHLGDTYLPIFWAQEGSQAGPEQLVKFRKLAVGRAVLKFLDGAAAIASAVGAAVVGTFVTVSGLVMNRSNGSGGGDSGVWREEDDEVDVEQLGSGGGGGGVTEPLLENVNEGVAEDGIRN